MSVQKGWAALSVPQRPDSPGGEQVCHSSGRRRAGVKFASQSSLESCAGLGLNPDSQQPAPHLHLPCQSLGLRPWRHTCRPVRFSPVLTPVGDPIQIPPSPGAWPRLPFPGCLAGCWVLGSTLQAALGSLGPGSQVPPPSPLAIAPWRPSWGWRAAASSLPSRSMAFSICRCVGQAPLWGDHRWQGDVLVGSGAVGAVPPPPSPDEGQGSMEHSR